MAKHSAPGKPAAAIEKSAMDIALGIQRPGQTKEQTKLIARGIEKGIAQHKKRQSAKERELDKALKQLERVAAAAAVAAPPVADGQPVQVVPQRQHWLPWTLLILTWVGIAGLAFYR